MGPKTGPISRSALCTSIFSNSPCLPTLEAPIPTRKVAEKTRDVKSNPSRTEQVSCPRMSGSSLAGSLRRAGGHSETSRRVQGLGLGLGFRGLGFWFSNSVHACKTKENRRHFLLLTFTLYDRHDDHCQGHDHQCHDQQVSSSLSSSSSSPS